MAFRRRVAYPPDLRRLRLGDRARPPPELPVELWLSILSAVDSDSPCDEVVDKCSVNQEWAGWCRDGTVYDLANKQLGWYGVYDSWQDLVTGFLQGTRRGRALNRRQGNNNMTPKAYFQHVCQDRREIVNLCVQLEDLHYDILKGTLSVQDLAQAYVARAGARNALRALMTDHARGGGDEPFTPYAFELFKFAVTINGNLLKHVPGSIDGFTRADPEPAAMGGYHELATLAIQQNGWALEFVHPLRADFGELARIAVQGFPMALRYVPGSDWYRRAAPTVAARADFGEIAGIALRSGKGIFSYRAIDAVPVTSPHHLALILERAEVFRGFDGVEPRLKDPSEGWWDIHGQEDGEPRMTFPDWAPKTKFALQAESAARITEIVNTTPMAASAATV